MFHCYCSLDPITTPTCPLYGWVLSHCCIASNSMVCRRNPRYVHYSLVNWQVACASNHDGPPDPSGCAGLASATCRTTLRALPRQQAWMSWGTNSSISGHGEFQLAKKRKDNYFNHLHLIPILGFEVHSRTFLCISAKRHGRTQNICQLAWQF